MKSSTWQSLIVALLIVSSVEGAQHEPRVEPWAEGVTQYQRFLLAPHLDAGFRYLNQKRYSDSIEAFSRARQIAPKNSVLTLYLAQAYRTAGDLGKAISVLREQIQVTPDNVALLGTLKEYEEHETDLLIDKAQTLKQTPLALSEFLSHAKPDLYNAYNERRWLELLASASTPQHDLIAKYTLKYPENENQKSVLVLDMLIRHDDVHRAKTFIDELSPSFLADIPLIDTLSYQLISASFPDLTMSLLMRAYPFRSASKHQKKTFMNRMALAQATAKDKNILRDFLVSHDDHFSSAKEEKLWLRTIYTALPNELDLLLQHDPKFDQNDLLIKKIIVREIQAGAPIPPDVDPVRLLDEVASLDPDLVDTLSYREIELRHLEHAWQILMSRYPFNENNADIQIKMLDRLAFILKSHPELANSTIRARLSRPLGTPALRSRQALLLSSLQDCTGVRQVLGDFSGKYTVSDWMILGDCYKNQYPGLAQHAYEQAFSLKASIVTARALAYGAYRNMDYSEAIKAWSFVLARPGVTVEDLRAAVVTALAIGQIADASRWLIQYDALGGIQDAQYWLLRAKIEADSNIHIAIESMQRAMSMEPTAEGYLQLAQWQREAGDNAGSTVSLQTGVKLDPNHAPLQADLGFSLYHEAHYFEAKQHLQRALSMRPNDVRLVEQLAYTDQRLGKNISAMRYVERAVDHQDSLPAEDLTPSMKEKVFSLRRLHEDLGRRWTFSIDAMIGSSPAASVSAPQPGQNYRSYAQAELDYRLGNPSINNGKTISVYGRVFGGSGTQNSVWPIHAPMLGVGLRWKPLSKQVIYLSLEKQIPLDHGTSAPANTMVRLSGSFLNDGRHSDDWKPVDPGWISQNLYLDSAYYLGNQAYSLTADYRLGYHRKIAEGQTIQPYLRGLANKISSETTPDLRVGLGLQWNVWGHQSRYNAYASKTYVALELQYAVKTYQSDRVTGLLNLGFRW